MPTATWSRGVAIAGVLFLLTGIILTATIVLAAAGILFLLSGILLIAFGGARASKPKPPVVSLRLQQGPTYYPLPPADLFATASTDLH